MATPTLNTYRPIKERTTYVYIWQLGRRVKARIFSESVKGSSFLVEYENEVYEVEAHDIY